MKYTKQQARDILGVIKGTSKADIEKKYDIVLKKHRVMKMDGTLDQKAEEAFQKSTDAYRILMGYEVDEPVQKADTYADKAFNKVGIDKKKADNFWHYHKFHIIIGLIAAIIIGYSVYSFVTRVEPDITIGLMGEVNQDSLDSFEAKIVKEMPGIKKVEFNPVILSNNYQVPQGYAYESKAQVLLAASDIDFFIISKYVYSSYAYDGPFMSLDEVARELNIDITKSEYLKLKVVDEWEQVTKNNKIERRVKTYRDKEPKLYGIDVTNSKFFKDLNIMGPEKILVVKLKPENRELIKKLIKLFAS